MLGAVGSEWVISQPMPLLEHIYWTMSRGEALKTAPYDRTEQGKTIETPRSGGVRGLGAKHTINRFLFDAGGANTP